MTGRPGLALPAILGFALAVHLIGWRSSEPFFSGDETRHVMTGIFVHDALRDGGYRNPRVYAERYYAQYPCLGLLVWPPGFYAVEGMAMLAFGPSHETGRALVLAYYLLAIAYFHRIARRTHGDTTAAAAAVLLVLSREVFISSHAVMLEVPTLACALGAIFHFEKYLIELRRRDLVFFAFWTVAAGLHRYDAAYLAPLFFARLTMEWKLRLLFTRGVVLAVAGIVLALLPAYWLAYSAVGQQHATGAGSGTNPAVVRHGIEQFTYYFSSLGFQLGLAAALAGAVGLIASFRRDSRAKSRPYWVIAAVVYGCFSLLAEQETRHTIYWLPAWCIFAAEAVFLPLRLYGRRWLTYFLIALVVGDAGCWTLRQPVKWVRGYADAAAFVLAHSEGPSIVVFDGHFDGTFIYGIRSQDAERRLWVARGDKILYAVKSDPGAGYVEWTKTEREIAETLETLAPDFVVVEVPPLKHKLPAQMALREVLMRRTDLFERVDAFPIRSNSIEWMDEGELVVYRFKNRAAGPRQLNIPMLWGGRDLSFDVKGH